ncbi:hypothetical protein [Archangium lansingense]|uniref:Uncharacterized protein n=1 Tax=Archangium lansingense TaxID=2995310 RepID=A0ABT4AP45_9BACT|nr:hypothetical protein [Archangium lansinium]MCY1082924.1 hypothetical protein [Archangium lansinium]
MTDPDNEWDDLEAGWDATGALVGSTRETSARKALIGPTPDEASSLEVLRSQAGGEARGTEAAPTWGDLARAREKECAGHALDTITDVDGHYLEPPD